MTRTKRMLMLLLHPVLPTCTSTAALALPCQLDSVVEHQKQRLAGPSGQQHASLTKYVQCGIQHMPTTRSEHTFNGLNRCYLGHNISKRSMHSLVAQCLCVQVDGALVGHAHVQRHILRTKHLLHGLVCVAAQGCSRRQQEAAAVRKER